MNFPARYLLDTNMVSYIANGRSPAARARLRGLPYGSEIVISSITEAEVLFGLARKPDAKRLREDVNLVLAKVLVLPWASAEARVYATLRTEMAVDGKSLTLMDALIAAHAIATDSILVTRDTAFAQIADLRTVNWATDV